MLAYDVSPKFISQYEDILKERISHVSSYFTNSNSLNAKSLSTFICHADDRLDEVNTSRAFLANRDNYLKPYVFDSQHLESSLNSQISNTCA